MAEDKNNNYLLSLMLKREALSSVNFLDLEKQYRGLDFSGKEKIMDDLIEYVTLPENEWFFILHRKTFVVWLTDWVWNYMNNYSLDTLVEIVPNTVFCAAVQGVPIVEKLAARLWYEKGDVDSVRVNYELMRSKIFSSKEKIGIKNGNDYLFSNLVSEVDELNKGGDSLSVAEIRVELQKIINQTLDEDFNGNYRANSKEDVAENVIDAINFFAGTEVDKVLYVCAGIVRADTYLDFSEQALGGLSEVITKTKQLKKNIDSQFPKTPTGEYEDIDGVMAELDRLATETGDDSIRDLYYFNESTGKFEWKE